MRGESLRIVSRGRAGLVTDNCGVLDKKDCQAGKRTEKCGGSKKYQKISDLSPLQGSCLRVLCWGRNKAWFPFWGCEAPQNKPTLFGLRSGDCWLV